MKNGKKTLPASVIIFGGEMIFCGLYQLLPLCFEMLPNQDHAAAAHMICLYLSPLLAAGVSLLASRRGVSPYAAFFPMGALLLLCGTFAPCAGVALVCLLVGLIASNIGAEMRKRAQKNTKRSGK